MSSLVIGVTWPINWGECAFYLNSWMPCFFFWLLWWWLVVGGYADGSMGWEGVEKGERWLLVLATWVSDLDRFVCAFDNPEFHSLQQCCSFHYANKFYLLESWFLVFFNLENKKQWEWKGSLKFFMWFFLFHSLNGNFFLLMELNLEAPPFQTLGNLWLVEAFLSFFVF